MKAKKLLAATLAFLMAVTALAVFPVGAAKNADMVNVPDASGAAVVGKNVTGTQSAESETPVIALTVIPPYGDKGGVFEGLVFSGNGGAFDPGDFRVVCYLQIAESGTWWVKPYSANFKTALEANGFFSIRTNTGGSDYNAVRFHFLLVPTEYFDNGGSADHNSVAAAAVDLVEVTRTSDGNITQTPERVVPKKEFRLPEISEDKLMLDVDFFTSGAPGSTTLTRKMIDEYFDTIAPFVNAVRIYDSFSDEYDHAYEKAKELGLYVVGSAWLDKNNTSEHYARLDKLIERANDGELDMAVISSEALLRGDFSKDKMIEYLQYVRERITDPTIAVTFADSLHFFYNDSRLTSYCDVIMPNQFPLWNGDSITWASDSFFSAVDSLISKYPNKDVVVSETGWSTYGSAVGEAEINPENAARYFNEVRTRSIEEGLRVFYFMAVDCPYKGTAANHNYIEAHFGIFTKDLVIKPEFADLAPFANAEIPHVRHTLTYVPAKDATKDAYGNTAYWKCDICGRYFADAGGETELSAADVIVKYRSAPGDANCDGIVDVSDIIQISMAILDDAIAVGEGADANCDKTIDVSDVILIAEHILDNTVVLGSGS